MGFVGAHMDDIELACAGTIQRIIKNGYEAVVLVISKSEKMVKANYRSAELLGYQLVLGDVPDNEIESTARVQQITFDKLIASYMLEVVFLHLPEDYHHEHRIASAGSVSACRRVKNVLYFAGPRGKPYLKPQLGILFGEEEMKKKLEAAKILKGAYGPTRYFTAEYLRGEALFWGQWFTEFIERPKAPKVTLFGKEQLPYAEPFQVERLRMAFEEGKAVLF